VSNAAADWGAVVVETDVDRAVIAPLMTWMPTYLTQTERERNLTPYLLARPLPESYQNVLEDDEFPDGRLPAVVVTTAQTDGDPEPIVVGVDAAYAAWWRVNASAVVRGRTPHETREIAALFGGCIRRILTQQPLELAGTVHWMGSSVTPFPDPTGQGRYLAAAVNRFRVLTDEALTGDGPVIPEPEDPPYPPPDPTNPDEPFDPLAQVRVVTTEIIARS
jgi:hypothetical protein